MFQEKNLEQKGAAVIKWEKKENERIFAAGQKSGKILNDFFTIRKPARERKIKLSQKIY